VRLTDGVVVLRPWADDDAWALVRLARSSPDIPRWTRVPSPYTLEDARLFLARCATGSDLQFALCRGEEPVGSIALMGDEVGYFASPEGRGQGLVTRAVRLLVASVDRPVCLNAAVENVPSQRVAERAGFVRAGFGVETVKGVAVPVVRYVFSPGGGERG
jgi:[ribosomal protein S5]-alanine N-acetyltransferase